MQRVGSGRKCDDRFWRKTKRRRKDTAEPRKSRRSKLSTAVVSDFAESAELPTNAEGYRKDIGMRVPEEHAMIPGFRINFDVPFRPERDSHAAVGAGFVDRIGRDPPPVW